MNFHINHLPELLPLLLKKSATGVVWLPGEKFVIQHLETPTAPKRKWIELVPWLLEDRVLQPVETMHFVLLGQDENQELSVLAVANDDMRGWLAIIKEKHLDNYQMLPDFLGLDWHPGRITVAQRAGLIIVRYGEFDGFAAESQLAWNMVKKIQRESDEPLTLLSFMPIEMIPESLQNGTQRRRKSFDWANAKPNVDMHLRVGEFRQRSAEHVSKIWWSSVALVFVTLGLGLVYLASLNHNLAAQLAVTESEFNTAYSQLFPQLEVGPEGIEYTVEEYLNSRLRQRESLATPVTRALIGLDEVISTCASCSVQTIALHEEGGELQLSNAGAELAEVYVPDFEVKISDQDELGNVLLKINRD